VDDPDFELNDDVELSESDDEDVIMVKENAANDGGCSEQVEVVGEGGVQGDDLGDDVEDSDDISSPLVSEDDEIQGSRFPKFKEATRPKDVQLVTGLLFTDKR